jgi:adenylate kinase family enzyme
LIKDAIYEKANKASGFLIDGFPRRVDQGKKTTTTKTVY